MFSTSASQVDASPFCLQDLSRLPFELQTQIITHLNCQFCSGHLSIRDIPLPLPIFRGPSLSQCKQASSFPSLYKGASAYSIYGSLKNHTFSDLCKQSANTLKHIQITGPSHDSIPLSPLQICRAAPHRLRLSSLCLGPAVLIDEVGLNAIVASIPSLHRLVVHSNVAITDDTLQMMGQQLRCLQVLTLQCDMRNCSEGMVIEMVSGMEGRLRELCIRGSVHSVRGEERNGEEVSWECVQELCKHLEALEIMEERVEEVMDIGRDGKGDGAMTCGGQYLRRLSLSLAESEGNEEMMQGLADLLCTHGHSLESLSIWFNVRLVRNHAAILTLIGDSCRYLKVLELCRVTVDEDLAELLSSYGPSLEAVRLWECEGHMTQAMGRTLAESLTNLSEIVLHGVSLHILAVYMILRQNRLRLSKVHIRNCVIESFEEFVPDALLAMSLEMCPNLEMLNIDVSKLDGERNCLRSAVGRRLKTLVMRVIGDVDIGIVEKQIGSLVSLEHVRVELDHDEESLDELDGHMNDLRVVALPFRHIYVQYIRSEAPSYSGYVVRGTFR